VDTPLLFEETNETSVLLSFTDPANPDPVTGEPGPFDLTGATVEFYLKPSAQTADTDASVLKPTSASSSEIDIRRTRWPRYRQVPGAAMTTAKHWFRADAIKSPSGRRTSTFGPVIVLDN
jgi:hypothetical protein